MNGNNDGNVKKSSSWVRSLPASLTTYSKTVEAVGFIAAIVLVIWWYYWPDVRFVPRTRFALLALLPGSIAIISYFASTLPRYRARHERVTDYARFNKAYDHWWQDTAWPRKLASLGLMPQQDTIPAVECSSPPEPVVDRAVDPPLDPPFFAATLWAALCLTFVFLIAASVADEHSRLAGRFPELVGQAVVMLPSSTTTTGTTTTSTKTTSTTTTSTTTTGGDKTDKAKTDAKVQITENDKRVIETKAINGLIFAALGAFVSVMWRMIKRINANALTSRFLFTAALRSAIAMMIGLAAGQFDLFGFLNPNGPRETVLLLTGLFTDWALDALRDRARTVFHPAANLISDQLPLDMVDGLDDGVIDILDEIGIWDVEHLATCEPGELTLRTLYPFNRVIDWIDQAVLINYLRRNIPAARDLGIRGAIDLVLLYSYVLEGNKPSAIESPPSTPALPAAAPSLTDTTRAARAWRTLDELATRSKISRDALEMICVNLWLDYTVEQLYRFRQHFAQVERATNSH